MKFSLTIILLSISLHSFSQTWQELNDSLIQYYNNGEYKKGVVAGEKALSDAKKEFGENHKDYATILSNIALGYASMEEYKKAEPLYIRVIEIRKKVLRFYTAPYLHTLMRCCLGWWQIGRAHV